jgi:hypothetical protein
MKSFSGDICIRDDSSNLKYFKGDYVICIAANLLCDVFDEFDLSDGNDVTDVPV